MAFVVARTLTLKYHLTSEQLVPPGGAGGAVVRASLSQDLDLDKAETNRWRDMFILIPVFVPFSFPPLSPPPPLSTLGAAVQRLRPQRHLHHRVRSGHGHVLHADGLHRGAADGE